MFNSCVKLPEGNSLLDSSKVRQFQMHNPILKSYTKNLSFSFVFSPKN